MRMRQGHFVVILPPTAVVFPWLDMSLTILNAACCPSPDHEDVEPRLAVWGHNRPEYDRPTEVIYDPPRPSILPSSIYPVFCN